MGIASLLPQLKSVTAKAHVSKYRGKRAAVDAYVLLHRGAYTCAREIVEGEPSDRCTEYCMARVQLLLGAGVVPVVIFDGGRLPNKDDEERNRHRSREENRAKARALWQQGNKTAAYECYQKAVDITPAVAKGFIDALKRKGVEFIVAPFEADAQMAYLAVNGLVDVVITEDSDLLAYGCPTVFFKMDRSGEGEEIELQNLVHARELSFIGFNHSMFQEMCVLAGCDFVKALPGIGIKKAHQHIRQRKSFIKVIKNLRFSGTQVPPDYEKRVQRALWVFQHQRVYCPQRQTLVHLREVPGGQLALGALVPSAAQLVDGEDDFLGPPMPDDIVRGIAAGELDPVTKQPYMMPGLWQPCTAQQQQDGPAQGSQASQLPGGQARGNTQQQQQQQQRHQQRHQQRQRSGQARAKASTAAAGGTLNTLARYGFLRSSGSAMKEYKQPRMASQEPDNSSQQQQQPAEQPLGSLSGEEVLVRQPGQGSIPAAATGMDRQSFLQSLQSADPGIQQQQQLAAAGSSALAAAGGVGMAGNRHAPGQPAAAAASSRPGVSALLSKLRSDLQGPRLEEVLQSRGSGAPAVLAGGQDEELECSLSAGAGGAAPAEVIPESPLQDSDLGGSLARQKLPVGPSPGHCGLQLPVPQITPGFYGVVDDDEQDDDLDGLLPPGSPRVEACGEAAPAAEEASEEAADVAISSLGHVHAFAQEAREAVDRVALQAVRESGLGPAAELRLPAPSYLQRRQQQQHASSATLKRPFTVPRKAAEPDKENGVAGLPGSKRSRPPAGQARDNNVFSRWACK